MIDVRVIISMMVWCNANVKEDQGLLPTAPLDLEYDNSSIEY